jgi:peptidyl-tRNA hydrolase, PTH1 family
MNKINNYIVVGLGNPGEEYEGTRHNVGMMVLDAFTKKTDFSLWEIDKVTKSVVSKGKVGKNKVLLLKPETFMNKSGEALSTLIKNKQLKIETKKINNEKVKALESLIVIHDDLDLPLGKIKISFNKNSGGHRGVESIIKTIKTTGFIRLRLGISSQNAKGKIKKPIGEDKVIDTILGKFKPAEIDLLKKTLKKGVLALELILTLGREKATSQLGTLK